MSTLERAAPSRTVIHLVPHTHWDREWYEPFQSFRMRLVELVDELLAQMRDDPEFRFTLDGQLATVDDYLEVRPEREAEIRALVEEGRLAIGPWLILMDEFLVSGETMVRNLEAGWRRAEELGGAMRVGYLPDMFGHVAQMPQILRRAGINDAVVWRGIPAAVAQSTFRWRAPDGSEVRAEYLVGGYGNAAFLFAIPDRLADKVAGYHDAMRPWYGDRSILAMYGTDHAVPVRNLEALAAAINASQDRYEMDIETLGQYVARARAADTDRTAVLTWTGELRSGARANVLAGVTSARIDLKAAAGRAETWLERYAEPLAAVWGAEWPESLLRIAWRKTIENSAHDSICGCSVDEVVAQVISRYAEAEQIGRGIAERAAAEAARTVRHGRTAIVNACPAPRAGLVELEVAVPTSWADVALELPDGSRVGTQEVARQASLLHVSDVAAGRVAASVARRRHGREMYQRNWNGYGLEDRDGTRELTLFVDRDPDPEWLDVDAMQHEIEAAAAAADPADRWRIRIAASPRRTLHAVVPAPALGVTSVHAVQAPGEVASPVRAEERALDNGMLRVEIEPEGTLRLRTENVDIRGVGRLVDGGDFGDSYNYGPPRHDRLVDEPIEVGVQRLAGGRVRGEFVVRRTYHWPLAVESDGSARTERTARTVVTTRIELRAGEPFVRIAVELENRSRDHRLRWHVPLPRRTEGSAAGSPFAIVQRGLEIEGGYGEVPIPTFPARDFVDAGGVAVLLDQVLEYEVVDEGRELALTLLRSIGLISRNENPWREDPAGPERAIPDAQCGGAWRVTFALLPHGTDWAAADAVRQAEHYRLPLLHAPGRASRDVPATEQAGLSIDGHAVALSALRRVGRELEARLVNLSDDASVATVRLADGVQRAREVDLLGRPSGADLALDTDELKLAIGPWEIRTIRVT